MSIAKYIKDFSKETIYNGTCAIEPEVDIDYLKPFIKEYGLETHTESTRIIEVDNMHLISKDKKEILINEFTNHYADKYPRGRDWNVSWWVHFHIFLWEKNKESFGRKFVLNNFNSWLLGTNLLHFPMFGKIYDNKVYHKKWMSIFSIPSKWVWWCKWYLFTYKDEFWYQSVEFRCNNVFDFRMYWYYIWLLLVTSLWIRLKKTSEHNVIPNKCNDWKPLPIWDIHLSKVSSYWNEIDKELFQSNLFLIYSLLISYWYTEACKELYNYFEDFIPEYNINTFDKIIDINTLLELKLWDTIYVVNIDWINFCSKTTIKPSFIRNFINKPTIGYAPIKLPNVDIKLIKLKNEKTYSRILNAEKMTR